MEIAAQLCLLLQMLSFASALSCLHRAAWRRSIRWRSRLVVSGWALTGLLSTMANALSAALAALLIGACASRCSRTTTRTRSRWRICGAFGSLGGAARSAHLARRDVFEPPDCCACIFTFLMALKSLVSVIYMVIKNADTDGDGVVSWRSSAPF